MPPSLRPHILGFISLAFITHPLRAQEQPVVKAELTTLSWKGSAKGLWFQTDAGPASLDIYDRGFTSPVSYRGSRVITFYNDRAAFSLDPEERPQPSAIATLPPEGGSLLLIFNQEDPEKTVWKVQVINNSVTDLPPGAYRFVNLTGNPYHAAFDKTVNRIKPSGITIIRPEKTTGTRDLPVRIALGNDIVYSSIWGHQEDRRGTVFILPGDKGNKTIGIRRYFQPVVPPKPQP